MANQTSLLERRHSWANQRMLFTEEKNSHKNSFRINRTKHKNINYGPEVLNQPLETNYCTINKVA